MASNSMCLLCINWAWAVCRPFPFLSWPGPFANWEAMISPKPRTMRAVIPRPLGVPWPSLCLSLQEAHQALPLCPMLPMARQEILGDSSASPRPKRRSGYSPRTPFFIPWFLSIQEINDLFIGAALSQRHRGRPPPLPQPVSLGLTMANADAPTMTPKCLAPGCPKLRNITEIVWHKENALKI